MPLEYPKGVERTKIRNELLDYSENYEEVLYNSCPIIIIYQINSFKLLIKVYVSLSL